MPYKVEHTYLNLNVIVERQPLKLLKIFYCSRSWIYTKNYSRRADIFCDYRKVLLRSLIEQEVHTMLP